MIDDSLVRESAQFLYYEAELLDRRKFPEWLTLLSGDIDYRVPIRTTRQMENGEGFSHKAFHFKETFATLRQRVARFGSEFAWSENPPSRTRRLITNIRVESADANGSHRVLSNFAVYSFRGEAPAPMILTGERQDMLCSTKVGWKLRERLVLLDSTIIGMESISILL